MNINIETINRVYQYIKEHPDVSHHDVAHALKIASLDALASINRLRNAGYLCAAHIYPLSFDNSENSCTFEICKRVQQINMSDSSAN